MPGLINKKQNQKEKKREKQKIQLDLKKNPITTFDGGHFGTRRWIGLQELLRLHLQLFDQLVRYVRFLHYKQTQKIELIH